ncbi:MAG: DNA polymerase [Saccharolobus sp.]
MGFLTYDSEAKFKIENNEVRHLFAVGCVSDGEKEICFKDPKKALEYLINSKSLVFIHNAKYDVSLMRISSFADMIQEASLESPFYLTFAGGTTIRDSVPILHSSLKNAIKTFAPELHYKEEAQVNYDKIETNPEEWNNYVEEHGEELAKNDARALHVVLTRFFSQIGKRGATLPSIAFKLLLEQMPEARGLKKALLDYEKYEDVISDINEPMVIESYRGGRVDPLVISSFSEKQRIYDVNSLYPTVMRNFAYPTVPVKDSFSFDQGVKRGYLGFHRVKFSCDVDLMPVVTKVKFNGEVILTQVLQNEAVLTTPEVIELINEGCKVTFISSKWFYAEDLFTGFIDKYYELKKKGEKIGGDEGKTLRTIAKMILNSAYGKFGLHKARSTLVTDPRIIMLIKRQGRTLLNGKYYTRIDDLVYTKEELTPRYSVAIASYVTAYARLYLFKLMKQNKEGLQYTDTDSLHLTKEIRETSDIKILNRRLRFKTVGDGLGQLKIEKEGNIYHLGKKLYFFTADPGEWVPINYKQQGDVAVGKNNITAKGVKRDQDVEIHYNPDPLKMYLFQNFRAVKSRLAYNVTITVPKTILVKARLKYHGDTKKIGEPIKPEV